MKVITYKVEDAQKAVEAVAEISKCGISALGLENMERLLEATRLLMGGYMQELPDENFTGDSQEEPGQEGDSGVE